MAKLRANGTEVLRRKGTRTDRNGDTWEMVLSIRTNDWILVKKTRIGKDGYRHRGGWKRYAKIRDGWESVADLFDLAFDIITMHGYDPEEG